MKWKKFFILIALNLLSVLFVFPYVLTVQGELIRNIGWPVWAIFTAQLIQSLILFSIAIFFGLFLAENVGLSLPLTEAILKKEEYKKIFKKIAGISALSGIAVAVIIYAVDYIFSFFGAAISTHQSYAPAWQKLLASFYGGITEETLMRLFLMSFFIWIGMKAFGKEEPSKTIVWISIIFAAVIFGLGHLPITASITDITPLVVARAVALNGIGGLAFGWLFWKKGLESAIIAHFTTDVFLLTVLPQIL